VVGACLKAPGMPFSRSCGDIPGRRVGRWMLPIMSWAYDGPFFAGLKPRGYERGQPKFADSSPSPGSARRTQSPPLERQKDQLSRGGVHPRPLIARR